MEFLDWGKSQIIFKNAEGVFVAFDVFMDIEHVDVGFYTDSLISKDNLSKSKYEEYEILYPLIKKEKLYKLGFCNSDCIQ